MQTMPTDSEPSAILFSLLPFIVIILFLIVFIKELGGEAKMACPICLGSGKLPDLAHDSQDIQFVNCVKCQGKGEM